MREPAAIYQDRIGDFLEQQEHWQRKLRFIPWFRLFMFGLIILAVVVFTRNGDPLFIVAAVISFSGFLIAGWYDFRVKRKLKSINIQIRINQHEIDAISWNYATFDPGLEFANEAHPYTHDLDIFGQGSLFQYINRTSTSYGKNRLSEYFIHAFQFSNNIASRQKAIAELARMIEFRQQLQGIFFDTGTQGNDLDALREWLENETEKIGNHFSSYLLKILLYLGPVVTVSCLITSIAGLTAAQLPIFLFMIQLLVVFGYGRKTAKVHQAISSQDKILSKYGAALNLIGETVFEQELNRKLQNDLMFHENEHPGLVIKRFSNLLKWMDSNLNMIIALILNGFLMFNIHLLFAVEGWRVKYRDLIPKWFEVLAEFDALSSIAVLSFNNPDFSFPEQAADQYRLSAVGIGHPLIPRDRCVKNDFEIRGWNQFSIITGANMSGKSTFLRTIGTNYLLAMMGAPVFAEIFIFYPIEIHSSIRTNDSLVKRESYFYAELKRLKEIIDDLENGCQKFILLDEILKGTNSSDKQTGSIALIKQLMKYNVAGMFATHDLALGDLINAYPDHIRNHCFEILIDKDRMEIDYKLRSGVCKNLNASFLMKKMGILLD